MYLSAILSSDSVELDNMLCHLIRYKPSSGNPHLDRDFPLKYQFRIPTGL